MRLLRHVWLFLADPRRRRDLVIVLLLALVTLSVRVYLANGRRIMPAGDAFMFQVIADHLRHGQYPKYEKRLPGYSLVLLLGRTFGLDPIPWSIGVSIASACGATIVLYSIGRRMGIRRVPLTPAVFLNSFSPALVVNGIRPLSDSFFLFLVLLAVFVSMSLKKGARQRYALGTGMVLALMMLTRYEGVPLAVVLLVVLFFRVGMRSLAAVVTPLLIGLALWLPLFRTTIDTWNDFPYVAQARASDAGDLTMFHRNLMVSLRGSGWLRVLDDLRAAADRPADDHHLLSVLRSPSWWLGLCALIGLGWMLTAGRREALPFLLVFVVYTVTLSTWWVYSRYVASLTVGNDLAIAAGLHVLWRGGAAIARKKSTSRDLVPGVLALCGFFLIGLEIRGRFREAQSRAWENTGRGYALYRAYRALAHLPGRVAVSHGGWETPMAYATFGFVDPQPLHDNILSRVYARRGVYLSAFPDDDPKQLLARLQERSVRYLVLTADDSRLAPLTDLLRKEGVVRDEMVFHWKLPDGNEDRVPVLELAWRIPPSS